MVKVIVRRNRTFTTMLRDVLSFLGNIKPYNELLDEYHGTLERLNNTQLELIAANAELIALRGSNARMAPQLEAHRNTRAKIAALETPHANATVRKMAALARGDA